MQASSGRLVELQRLRGGQVFCEEDWESKVVVVMSQGKKQGATKRLPLSASRAPCHTRALSHGKPRHERTSRRRPVAIHPQPQSASVQCAARHYRPSISAHCRKLVA